MLLENERKIRFSPSQKLPEGYTVIWSEGDEHYHCINADKEDGPYCSRWQAYRAAWNAATRKKDNR